MPAHLREDLSASRVRIPLQQIGRAHDLVGLTIAALRRPLGQPSLLHGMRGIRRKPLDRRHFLAGNIRHLRLARKRALTVDMHHAGAAEAYAAAELGAGEFQFFPDHPKQRRNGGRLHADSRTIHCELEGHLATPSLPSDLPLLTGSLSGQSTNGNDTCLSAPCLPYLWSVNVERRSRPGFPRRLKKWREFRAFDDSETSFVNKLCVAPCLIRWEDQPEVGIDLANMTFWLRDDDSLYTDRDGLLDPTQVNSSIVLAYGAVYLGFILARASCILDLLPWNERAPNFI